MESPPSDLKTGISGMLSAKSSMPGPGLRGGGSRMEKFGETKEHDRDID